jgi:hypothetical protein
MFTLEYNISLHGKGKPKKSTYLALYAMEGYHKEYLMKPEAGIDGELRPTVTRISAELGATAISV